MTDSKPLDPTYVIASQQSWGERVFATLSNSPNWYLVRTLDTLRSEIIIRQPRYVFFLSWSSRVPSDVLAQTECVNFHCTALPYGRGGGPIENLILRGHSETVLTAHRMVDEIDAGPIYGQRGPISLDGTKEQILERFVCPCIDLIRWLIATNPVPRPQVGEVVVFSRLSKDEYEMFWRRRR